MLLLHLLTNEHKEGAAFGASNAIAEYFQTAKIDKRADKKLEAIMFGATANRNGQKACDQPWQR